MNMRVDKSLESLARIASKLPVPVRHDKFTARRNELAEATLGTLATLGYANTSLREIAQNTNFSHGVLHYYFKDKVDLISCCVTHYKNICVTRYDDVVLNATNAEELLDGFTERLAMSLTDEAPLHRLWYDLRNQSMFEPAYRDDVMAIDKSIETMISRICIRYSTLCASRPLIPSRSIYAIFDGIFLNALLRYIGGDEVAVTDLKTEIRSILPSLLSDD